MGTESQGGPTHSLSPGPIHISQNYTKWSAVTQSSRRRGQFFVRIAQLNCLAQPWFDSVEIILSAVTNSKWFIHSSPASASPPPSRAALCCFLGLIMGYIFQILSLIMLPFEINTRNVWNVFSVSNMTFHFLVHRSKWLFLDQAMMLCLMNWIIPKSRDGPWVWIIWGEESSHYLRTMLSAKSWEPPINTVHKWIFVAQGGYLINSTLMDENLCINNDFWESPASQACAECTSHFL